ncbi:MAG: RHS repeat-associated core domain-containing protein, partial [Phycisphaerae bacterium]|nr:RHS repeat-associated core domain-containing protein [Phycisphaerae bacterium]
MPRTDRIAIDGVIIRYYYDGQRVLLEIDAVAGQTTLYYNDPEWRVLAEYAPTNNQQLRKYVYGNYIDETLVLIDTYDSDNSPVGTYYFLHDHLYSPAVLIGYDEENEIWQPVERYEFDAYGTARIMDPGFGNRIATQYGVTTLFTGRTLDALDSGNLKIMYYRHRYTDPFTGRFLQQDPMEYIDGLNLYEYVESNPIILLDPSGSKNQRWYPSGKLRDGNV